MQREKQCRRCKGMLASQELRINGISVRGSVCLACGDIAIEGNLSQILLFSKLKSEKYHSTVGLLGNSLIIRIPKDYSDAYKLGKGQEVVLETAGSSSFLIKVKECSYAEE